MFSNSHFLERLDHSSSPAVTGIWTSGPIEQRNTWYVPLWIAMTQSNSWCWNFWCRASSVWSKNTEKNSHIFFLFTVRGMRSAEFVHWMNYILLLQKSRRSKGVMLPVFGRKIQKILVDSHSSENIGLPFFRIKFLLGLQLFRHSCYWSFWPYIIWF